MVASVARRAAGVAGRGARRVLWGCGAARRGAARLSSACPSLERTRPRVLHPPHATTDTRLPAAETAQSQQITNMMDKPKRPMSAYLLWLNSARAQIKAEHPGLKVTEVAKKAGELWRAMEDKSTWEQRAAAAKEQYTQDLEAFNATGAAPPAKRAQKRAPKARQQKTKKEKVEVKKELSDDEGDDDDVDDDDEDESE